MRLAQGSPFPGDLQNAGPVAYNLNAGPVAQWTEQGTPKPLVGGSIPSGPARIHQGFPLL